MSARTKLVALVGAASAAILLQFIPAKEGVRYVGYLDAAGIPTKCMGDTKDAVVGKRYTPDECAESMDAALVRHAEPVLRCTPSLKDKPQQLAAAVSLAYNIGAAAYCAGPVARLTNANDMTGACAAYMQYVCITVPDGQGDRTGRCASKRINKRFLKGLENRRDAERALCEGRYVDH